MVEIGGKPMLSHIMGIYKKYGYSDFLIACGYKGEMIREYYAGDPHVTCLDTGLDSGTGERVRMCAERIGAPFMLTYGDGVADIDIRMLLGIHRAWERAATVTAIHPPARFGQIKVFLNQVIEFNVQFVVTGARLEMEFSNEIQVLPTEMHPVQFPVHLDALEQLIAAIDSGEQPLEEAAPKLFPLHTHASAHAEFMVGEPDYPEIKKRLQQIDEVAWNLAKRLEKLRRDAALAQGDPNDPNNPGAPSAEGGNAANPNALPDTLQRQMVEASTKLRIAEETHSQQLRHREQAFMQAQALKDAEVAAAIARKQYS
jgi:hypothetical protein